MTQGFRKWFSAWGLNFKQFLAGFNFEIVGHNYKDFVNKNKRVQHRCTLTLKLWKSNQKEITNMKHMVYILTKNSLYLFIFFSNQSIVLHQSWCFQKGSCLLLGNKGSMQGQQSRQGTQWSPCGINAGKQSLSKKSQEKNQYWFR